jgi:hypothetical protein
MFRRRLLSTIAMIVLVTGVLGGGPARAQAPLGFTIAPTQGLPGDTVTGQVNVADVAASCVTDLAEFQARFNDVALNVLAFSAPDPLWLRFFPADVMDILTTIETHDQLAYTLTLLVTIGIGTNQGGAAEAALPQTFVMTFADLATQDPVGELGHFDPVTGVGSVVVPDVAPGPWAVAAVCVGPSFDRDALEAGIRSSGSFLEEIGAPAVSPIAPEFEAWAQGYLGSTNTGFDLIIEFATAVGPTLVQNIAAFDALGVQVFTVLAQPETKRDCKKGGWKNFPGLGFTNQGQCIAFVNTGQRPTTTTTAPTTTTTTTTSTTTTTMGSPSGAFLEDAANLFD